MQQQQSASSEGLTNRTSLGFGDDGQSSAPPAATKDGYKFGDFSRGLVGSIRGMRQQNHSDNGNESNSGSGNYLKENKGRFAGVAGSTAGAVMGLLIAGPVGAIAGSFIGSSSCQNAVQKQEEKQQQQH